jgi:hypothetical protein
VVIWYILPLLVYSTKESGNPASKTEEGPSYTLEQELKLGQNIECCNAFNVVITPVPKKRSGHQYRMGNCFEWFGTTWVTRLGEFSLNGRLSV